MSTRLLVTLALALIAGCGGGGDERPVQGPPAERYGAQPAERIAAVERIRSRLAPASDLYEVGRPDDAFAHLGAARRLWAGLSREVRRRDPVLEREVAVAFDRVERAMRERGTFDTVRDRIAPLGSQLLDGVREELVEKEARLDPGVQAAVVVRLLEELERRYENGLGSGGRLALQHAFGLLDRSQAVAREFAGDLGPKRDAVIEGLKDLREAAFPDDVVLPRSPAPLAEVRRRAGDIRQALVDRFQL